MKNLFIIFFVLVANFAGAQIITTIAGTGSYGYTGDGGQALQAQLTGINALCFDNQGNLYILSGSWGNTVRKIDVNGIITTIAGNGTAGFSGDGGPAVNAQFDSWEAGMTIDDNGNLYIADEHNGRIRKIDANGIITTFAGFGGTGYTGDGGPATAASFSRVGPIAADHAGNIYVGDRDNHAIRKIDVNGIITTVAGGNGSGSTGDGGLATLAQLTKIISLNVDNMGNLYIGDYDAAKIRKVDANGIITTYLGTGNSGSSGDGGPATLADIHNDWGNSTVDEMGNYYYMDYHGHRVRKVDAGGIVDAFAGTGTQGNSGDGGLAIAAELFHPHGCAVDPSGNVYIGDENFVIRKVHNAPAYTADSFSIFIQNSCGSTQFSAHVNNYQPGMTIQTYFGDGTNTTVNVATNGMVYFPHSYAHTGNYPVKQVLYINTIAVDSFQFSFQHNMCNTFAVSYYNDANNNCTKDSSDLLINKPFLVEVDSNGISIDTISCMSGFSYTTYGNTNDIYQFKLISIAGDLTATCPVTGIVSDTLRAGFHPTRYVGLNCTGGNDFDLIVHVDSRAGFHALESNVYLENLYCAPQNAVLTINYNTAYNTFYAVDPPPTSQGPGTVSWNVASLSNSQNEHIYIILDGAQWPTGIPVTTSYTVTPTTGDQDPVNNSTIVIDTTEGGFDPNAIYAHPSGCVAAGTNLEYTITFENMGNGAAENIYVMDTLPSGLDVSSMKVKFASHNMLVNKITDGNQTILKFDFPNIMLPDSSDHVGRHGMLKYTINVNSNLPFGASMDHDASIYFDYNPPVLTNNAHTGICWPAGISNASIKDGIQLFPNPATYELTIKTADTYSSYTITNSIGQVMQEDVLNRKETKLDIKALTTGVYYISLKGDKGTDVKKFIKL